MDEHGPTTSQEPSRHIFDRICRSLYEGFRGELTWQTGLNIRIRYSNLRSMPLDGLSGDEEMQLRAIKDKASSELRAEIRKGGIYLEDKVIASPSYRLAVNELNRRIPFAEHATLLKKSLVILKPYFAESGRLRIIFNTQYEILERAYENNMEFELVKIQESRALYERFTKEMQSIDNLRFLHIEHIETEGGSQTTNVIQTMIYIGAVLYTLQSSFEWGSVVKTLESKENN